MADVKTKSSRGASKTAAPDPTRITKLYLIRAEDVAGFTFSRDGEPVGAADVRRMSAEEKKALSITSIELTGAARVLQIDDTPEGKKILTTNIRRIVGERVSQKLIKGDDVAPRPSTLKTN